MGARKVWLAALTGAAMLAAGGAQASAAPDAGEQCLAHHLAKPDRAGRFAGMSVVRFRQRGDRVIVTLEKISIRHLNVERTMIACALSDLDAPQPAG